MKITKTKNFVVADSGHSEQQLTGEAKIKEIHDTFDALDGKRVFLNNSISNTIKCVNHTTANLPTFEEAVCEIGRTSAYHIYKNYKN
jgi:hypothetical protein